MTRQTGPTRIVCIVGNDDDHPLDEAVAGDNTAGTQIVVLRSTAAILSENLQLPPENAVTRWFDNPDHPFNRACVAEPRGGRNAPLWQPVTSGSARSFLVHADRFVVCADAFRYDTQKAVMLALDQINPHADCLVLPFRNGYFAYGRDMVAFRSAPFLASRPELLALPNQYGTSAAGALARIVGGRRVLRALVHLEGGRCGAVHDSPLDFLHIQLLYHLRRRSDGMQCDYSGVESEAYAKGLGIDCWRASLLRNSNTTELVDAPDGRSGLLSITSAGLELLSNCPVEMEDPGFSERATAWSAMSGPDADAELYRYRERMRRVLARHDAERRPPTEAAA